MRKTYSFQAEGRHPDRVLESVKHDIRKYLKRERRRDLPEGADFWDFDCRIGADKDSSEGVLQSGLIAQVDDIAKGGAAQAYVEVLARAAQRPPRPEGWVSKHEAALAEGLAAGLDEHGDDGEDDADDTEQEQKP